METSGLLLPPFAFDERFASCVQWRRLHAPPRTGTDNGAMNELAAAASALAMSEDPKSDEDATLEMMCDSVVTAEESVLAVEDAASQIAQTCDITDFGRDLV